MRTPNPTSWTRLAIAFVISPLVAALSIGAWMWVETGAPGRSTTTTIIWDTIIFSYLAVLVFGLPLTALFAAMGLRQWWQYTIAGLILGMTLMILNYQLIPISEMPGAGGEDYYQPIDWLRSLSIGLVAALTATTFWWCRYGKLGRKSGVNGLDS